jgi:aspartyl protease family protein
MTLQIATVLILGLMTGLTLADGAADGQQISDTVSVENAVQDVEVLGLFTDAAVLLIGGERQLLRKDQRSKEGVLLVSANSREAVIEYAGSLHTLAVSSRISAAFAEPTVKMVTIPLNERGQYLAGGSINGVPVEFLLDTGASAVAMNSRTAHGLRIDTSGGRSMQATTAGGIVSTTEVVLDSVKVGEIKISNVRALVIDGEYPKHILLGMTFLRQVDMAEDTGLMVLKSKL